MEKTAEEVHGRPGWRKKDDGSLEEMVFVDGQGTATGKWIVVAEYRRMQAERLRTNCQFYELHPALLIEKIREKRLRREMKHTQRFPLSPGAAPWNS